MLPIFIFQSRITYIFISTFLYIFPNLISMMHIDWNERWKEQMRAYLSSLGTSQVGYWAEDSAKQFNEFNKSSNWAKGNKIIAELDVRPGDRVLDIGSGPGSVAIPLSPRVSEIVAVEPNEHMVALLRENMAKQSVTNISVVEKLWDDVNVQTDLESLYDIVLSSFSLGVIDLRDALEKMVESAGRDIYIFWFSGNTWHERDRQFIYETILDKQYCPSPKADIIYNVLYSMGIYPNVTSSVGGPTRSFDSIDGARDYLIKKYKISPEHDLRPLDEYVAGRITREHGSYVLSESHIKTKIWWRVGQRG